LVGYGVAWDWDGSLGEACGQVYAAQNLIQDASDLGGRVQSLVAVQSVVYEAL